FTAVDPHSKLSYTDAMSDADGNVMSPESMGMPANHPESTEVIVELEEADGGTKMTMTHVGVPAGSPGAMGWGMALDKLEAHVAAR
ncbi:MAG: SRPBCC domain-containing protein, partial [Acidimicrobiia bacterium]|nr:SRPBCC domain-containing protein [Acidimicrobiia bacterium]